MKLGARGIDDVESREESVMKFVIVEDGITQMQDRWSRRHH